MVYDDRRASRVKVADLLRAAGWTIHGFREDQSDMMTDYYCPTSWNGLASKGEFVAVLDNGPHNSGRAIYERYERDAGECPACKGTGIDPSGWTLKKARANPREYHKATQQGAAVSIWLLTDDPNPPVSPIPFREDGHLRCRHVAKGIGAAGESMRGACHEGRIVVSGLQVVGHLPTCQPLPKGKTWAVERNGKVVASGVGLKNPDRVAERIIDAATGRNPRRDMTPNPIDIPDGMVAMHENEERGGIELRFGAKPAESVRELLKANGWRWSRHGACWYKKASDNARAFAMAIVAEGAA